jgi:predicted TIM-barrel fold metal-dependent hydrolase
VATAGCFVRPGGGTNFRVSLAEDDNFRQELVLPVITSMKPPARLFPSLRIALPLLLATGGAGLLALSATEPAAVPAAVSWEDYTFHDSHFHLTNYIQQGTGIHSFLEMMGKRTGRVALFGIPLQQTWTFQNSGDVPPGYYLESDAPLYYYSFTDAWIARTWLSLPEQDRMRFDPMITGFNPSDMYAADHIKRVLQTFQGVFCGIGEFSIHKEFVSSKIAGGPASLTDPALDRVFDFAGEAGLLTLIHCDVGTPFPKATTPNVYLNQIKTLFRRHPGTTVIWAHMGLGRVIQPLADHPGELAKILDDPEMSHVNFDISWDETAKYIVANEASLSAYAALMNKHADRFLFGSDSLSPATEDKYLKCYNDYQPLWKALSEETRKKVLKGNYERLFDAAKVRVRQWEAGHPVSY